MYVSEYMKTPVITVLESALILEAQNTMKEHKIRRVPVVDIEGHLVGLVTQDKLRETIPSPHTPMSVWDLQYQLSKILVRNVMVKDVLTVTPETTVEATCVLGQEHNVGTLPVVDEQRKLVGIVTTTDLYRITTEILGFGRKGVRLYVSGDKQDVVHHEVLGILSKHKAEVLAIFPVAPVGSQKKNFVVHLATEEAGPIAQDIEGLGLKVEIRKH